MKIICLIFTLTLTTCQTVVGVGKVKAYSELAKKLGRVTKLERVIVTGKVTEKQGLRIREKPTTSSKQLGIIPVDGAVRITSLEGPEETIYGITSRWYELVYEGQAGWAFGGFISYEKTKVTKYVEKKTDGEEIDKNFGLKLRKKAGRSSETLGHIAFGEKLEVLDDTTGLQETIYDIPGRWLKVRYGEKVGWVFGGLVEYEKEKKEEKAESRKTFTNSSGIEFVLIPAGEFSMGCSPGDEKCHENEKPLHKVKITKPFYMGKFEVTQKQWRDIMGKNKLNTCGDNCPVQTVSWPEVQEFIKKLNEQVMNGHDHSLQGYRYRLPTEAEWEYAARAGTTTRYYFGKDASTLGDYAWYRNNSGRKIHPVGMKKPNAFELYDMIGNVWEWVEDTYDKDYYSKSPEKDPKNEKKAPYRVFRGGGSNYGLERCRVSDRYYWIPDYYSIDVGFRLVLSLRERIAQ